MTSPHADKHPPRPTRHRLVGLLLLACATLAATVLGAFSADSTALARPAGTPSARQPVRPVGNKPGHRFQTLTAAERQTALAQNLAGATAASLDDFGTAHYSTSYGGTTLTDNGTAITVFLTKLDPAVETALQTQSPATPLTFAETRSTQQDRRNLAGDLAQAWHTLRQQEYQLVKGVEDVAAGTETVQLVQPTAAQIVALTARFGPHLTIQAVTPDQQVFAASRSNDSAPCTAGTGSATPPTPMTTTHTTAPPASQPGTHQAASTSSPQHTASHWAITSSTTPPPSQPAPEPKSARSPHATTEPAASTPNSSKARLPTATPGSGAPPPPLTHPSPAPGQPSEAQWSASTVRSRASTATLWSARLANR